mgnify:FL=1
MNKIFSIFLLTVFLNHCGFSPIYIGNPKEIIVSKLEIIGDKNLAFDFERKLSFKKDEKNLNAYTFRAQIFDTSETSLVDTRGIATEEIIKLTVSYQFQDKNGVIAYQDSITKIKELL